MKTVCFVLGFFFTLAYFGCSRNGVKNHDPPEPVAGPKAIRYPAEVRIKVKGLVPCYKNSREDCLVLQDGYLWKGYPFEIDGWTYKSGEYTLWVLAEEETNRQGEPYLTYKYLKTLNHNKDIESKRNCNKKADPGPCEAAAPRAEFTGRSCQQFFYGGCDGFVPFDSVEECRLYCE